MTSPRFAHGRTAVPFRRGERISLSPSPDSPDPADLPSVRAWVAAQTEPTAVDLFSGAGGLSLGLKRAGFSILLGADNDPIAVETHTHNVGGLGWVGDLADPVGLQESLSAWGMEHVDLVAGGVPCQPFSRAGESRLKELVAAGIRSSNDPRAGLWQSFLAIVETLDPRAVLVENVPDLPRWNDGAVLIGLLEGLRGLGYDVDARVLSAFEHGVPQHRARLFIVGLRDTGTLEWPSPNDEGLTLRDAIGDLPPVPGGHWNQRIRYLESRQTGPYQGRMRAGLRGEDRWFLDDHVTREVRPDDLAAYELLQEGQTYKDLPEALQRYRTDIFTDKYKRLSWAAVGRSITAHIAKDGYWYIHPSQNRTLSIREAARVQSFPDDFRFAGQPSHRFRQVGNAVPPLLAEGLGQALTAALAHEVPSPASRDRDAARERLLAWYEGQEAHPWRNPDASPWGVLLGEFCLARTRLTDARQWFPRLLAVAQSPRSTVLNEDEVRNRLLTLGYPQRADRLLDLASGVIDDFGGDVPDDHMALRCLPGVGDHLAQVVLCYGFGRVGAPLDRPAARVVGRWVGSDTGGRWQTRLDLHRLAGTGGPDAAFNAALDTLASTTCLTAEPNCSHCPLLSGCATGLRHRSSGQLDLEQAA